MNKSQSGGNGSVKSEVVRGRIRVVLGSYEVVLGLYWGRIRVVLVSYYGRIGVVLGLFWGSLESNEFPRGVVSEERS